MRLRKLMQETTSWRGRIRRNIIETEYLPRPRERKINPSDMGVDISELSGLGHI